jgi:hypothetical protein
VPLDRGKTVHKLEMSGRQPHARAQREQRVKAQVEPNQLRQSIVLNQRPQTQAQRQQSVACSKPV